MLMLLLLLSATACIKEEKDRRPVLTTYSVIDLTPASATCGGDITDDKGDDVTARGVCWSTDEMPKTTGTKTTDGSGSGLFYSTITGLTPNTSYWVRAYASNVFGTAYGKAVSFKTPEIVTDVDGNTYTSVALGTQVWLDKNLVVFHYRNGDPIPSVFDKHTWSIMISGACCQYEYMDENRRQYGLLYNGYAVNDPRGLAPEGWHVATAEDWNVLTEWAGGKYEAAASLKEPGTTHWQEPNFVKFDKGFGALPGGICDNAGTFSLTGITGFWWSSTGTNPGLTWCYQMNNAYNDVGTAEFQFVFGMSVRCVKD